MNSDRQFILMEIQRLHRETGRSPGIALFAKMTGIPSHRIMSVHWAKWSEALAEAGLSSNKLTQKFDSDDLLRGLARFTRHLGRYPSQTDIKLAKRQGEPLANPDVYTDHFVSASGVRQALQRFCECNPEYGDIRQIIPDYEEPTLATPGLHYGHVYLLQGGGYYKIGRTDTLERRIKEISVSLPTTVTLIHTISTDDPVGIEAYWHRRFADRRANGEWFKLSRDDVAAFRRRKFQ